MMRKCFVFICKLSVFDGDVHLGACMQRVQWPLASLHSVTFLAVSQSRCHDVSKNQVWIWEWKSLHGTAVQNKKLPNLCSRL